MTTNINASGDGVNGAVGGVIGVVTVPRCNTDILFGKNCGMQTLVVMSGVTTESDLKKWSASDDPDHHALLADYCLTQLDDLLPFMEG